MHKKVSFRLRTAIIVSISFNFGINSKQKYVNFAISTKMLGYMEAQCLHDDENITFTKLIHNK